MKHLTSFESRAMASMMGFWYEDVCERFKDTYGLTKHQHLWTAFSRIVGVESKGIHRALDDAKMLKTVYEYMKTNPVNPFPELSKETIIEKENSSPVNLPKTRILTKNENALPAIKLTIPIVVVKGKNNRAQIIQVFDKITDAVHWTIKERKLDENASPATIAKNIKKACQNNSTYNCYYWRFTTPEEIIRIKGEMKNV